MINVVRKVMAAESYAANFDMFPGMNPLGLLTNPKSLLREILTTFGYPEYHQIKPQMRERGGAFVGSISKKLDATLSIVDLEYHTKGPRVQKSGGLVMKTFEDKQIDIATTWTHNIPIYTGDELQASSTINIDDLAQRDGLGSGSCNISGFEKSIMNGVLAMPYNILGAIYDLIRGLDPREIIELGALFKVTAGVIHREDLVLDEVVFTPSHIFGIRPFELRDSTHTIARIQKNLWKYILTAGMWESYDITVFDKEYTGKKTYHALFTGMADFVRNLEHPQYAPKPKPEPAAEEQRAANPASARQALEQRQQQQGGLRRTG